jgi:threonine dehydratase
VTPVLPQQSMLNSLDWTDQIRQALLQPAFSPKISGNGTITLPGFLNPFTIAQYRFLASTFASILDADTLLQGYAEELGRFPQLVSPAQTNDSSSVDAPPPLPAALTPLDRSRQYPTLFYKREDLTITQAYKVRGAVNAMATVMEAQGCNRFLAVSTGNHALGVLKAAEILRPDSVRIIVPNNTTPAKLQKLQRKAEQLRLDGLLAQVLVRGDSFDQSREWALMQNEAEFLISPYDDPWVVAGQGSIGMELLRQLGLMLSQTDHPPDELVLIAPIGGGGLLGGTATALRMGMAWHPAFTTIHKSIQLRCVGMRLASLSSELGDAIRVKYPGPSNQQLFALTEVEQHRMTDPDMQAGMTFVYQDINARIEGACGGTLHPVLSDDPLFNAFKPSPHRWVVCLLSGGNL